MPKALPLLALLASALLASGCAANCDDACTALDACFQAIGSPSEQPHSECVKACEAETGCGDNKTEFLNCLADMECKTPTSALGEMMTCSAECPAAMQ